MKCSTPVEFSIKELIEICEKVISLQEKMKNSYFWDPPQSASTRRSYESYNSQSYEFIYKGKKYKFCQSTVCSCRNVYFSSVFCINDERKDLRLVRKLLKDLRNELKDESDFSDCKSSKE